jgi:hypothetical protein
MLRSLLLFLLLASSAAHAYAQDPPPLDRRLMLSLGGYRFHDAGYEPTPRVEFSADLLRLHGARLDLGAALSWSRLEYRAEEPYRDCSHCPPGHDYGGHGFGGRLYTELVAAPLPVRLSAGLFHHFGRGEYHAAELGQFERDDYTRRATTAEFGLGLAWPLHRRFEAATDARVYAPLGTSAGSNPDLSLSIGVGVRL